MIYVVEAQRAPQEETDIAYFMLGPEDEGERFALYVGSLALESMHNTLTVDGVWGLSQDLEMRAFCNIHSLDFLTLLSKEDELADERRAKLLLSAARGNLTIHQVTQELDLHQITNGEDYEIIDRRGLASRVKKDATGIETFYDPEIKDLFSDDTAEAAVAELVGLNAWAEQYELVYDEAGVPLLTTQRSHHSVGTLVADNYTPMLTILNEKHPVRLGKIFTAEQIKAQLQKPEIQE